METPDTTGIRWERQPGARVCVVTFGSRINLGRTEPTFAFGATIRKVQQANPAPFDVLYVRAPGNDWYTNGIVDLGPDIGGSADAMCALLAPYERTVFIGNSMGGFAAILFGSLLGADSVVAFGPQTNITRDYLDSIEDRRWRRDYELIWQTRADACLDLTDALSASTGAGNVSVFVGADSREDVLHARRIEVLPGVDVRSVPDEGHDLVHGMRSRGELESLLIARLHKP